jgi:hypothetical protein
MKNVCSIECRGRSLPNQYFSALVAIVPQNYTANKVFPPSRNIHACYFKLPRQQRESNAEFDIDV